MGAATLKGREYVRARSAQETLSPAEPGATLGDEMSTTSRITSDTTVAEIQEMLYEDGYSHLAERAAEIKRAAMRGALLWTKHRIVTTDRSRISSRPAMAYLNHEEE